MKNEFKGLEKQLEEIVEDAELTEEVEISQTIKGIEIQMEGSSLYESCSADVNDDMAPIITTISKTVKKNSSMTPARPQLR